MRPGAVPRPVLVVLAVVVATAAPAVALGGGPLAATDEGPDENSTGVQLTAYMQSTAEGTNATVETGLWVAAMDRSGNPENELRKRAGELEARLDRLRNRSNSLNRTRANGSLSPVVYNARAAAVSARVDGLQAAVEATTETADRFGVNVSELETLRAEARNLSGPAVAAIARNLTSRGPPALAGNASADRRGANGNQTGPPEDPGGAGDGGPPGDEGPPGQADETQGPDRTDGSGPAGEPGSEDDQSSSASESDDGDSTESDDEDSTESDDEDSTESDSTDDADLERIFHS